MARLRSLKAEIRHVELPFAPRPWQRPLIDDPRPRIVAVVNRRAGKSTALMWRGIRRCLTEPKPLARVVHILPYGVMWKRSGLWNQVLRAAAAVPGAVPVRSEMMIRFANGAVFQCGGADNPDSWRGGYADEVSIDEFDDTPKSMVPLIIEPMLADREGTLIRSGTPKGRGLLQAALDRARVSPGYGAYFLDYRMTRALSDEAIATLKREMTEEEFAQEFECSFNTPNSGSYFGKWMDAAAKEDRIGKVLYDPALQVHTAWDLGIDDSMAIWWFQVSPRGEWRWLEYYEDDDQGLDAYAKLVREKPYVYRRHILPHDVKVRELTFGGRSRLDYLVGIGLKPIQVVAAANPADRVSASRMVMQKSWFDAEGCALGIKRLRAYRRQWNEKMGVWRPEPVHDESSHGADAFGTGVQGATDPQDEKPKRPPRGQDFGAGGSNAWMAG